MTCPAGKKECPCQDYAKQGLCDWPYKNGMTLEEIQQTTQLKKGGN